jgi:hypothetical protein
MEGLPGMLCLLVGGEMRKETKMEREKRKMEIGDPAAQGTGPMAVWTCVACLPQHSWRFQWRARASGIRIPYD